MKYVIALCLLLSLVSPLAAQDTSITLTDATGAEIRLNPPQRFISGSGDVTEIIYALGAEAGLIAIENSATYPPEALETLPSIGFGRQLSLEPIVALNPDVFFCTQACSPDSILEQLRQLGITVIILPDSEPADLTLPRQKIEMLAQALGIPDKGQELAEQVTREIDWVQTALVNQTTPPTVFNFYMRGRGLQLAAGSGTPADAMIQGAGGINAATEAGVESWQPLSAEIILTAFPDWIVLTEGNVEASGGMEEILKVQGLNATPAVKTGQIIVLDTSYFLGLSTRTGQALMELAQIFHPQTTWEHHISYPYSYTDLTGETITLEVAPSILITHHPDLLTLTRQLGFHSQMMDFIPITSLIIATEGENWASLREAGATVIVVADDFSIDEVATALNVTGRGAALQARLAN